MEELAIHGRQVKRFKQKALAETGQIECEQHRAVVDELHPERTGVMCLCIDANSEYGTEATTGRHDFKSAAVTQRAGRCSHRLKCD